MSFDQLAMPAVIVISLTAISLLLTSDWRISLVLLAIQCLGVFVLVALSWPIEMAATVLIAGWIASAVMGMAKAASSTGHTNPDFPGNQAGNVPQHKFLDRVLADGRPFQLITGILVWLSMLFLSSIFIQRIPEIGLPQSLGGMFLVGLALLKLGFSKSVFGVMTGLLTFLAGFQIMYAAVESSTLVAGLLASFSMGLALIAAYLIVSPELSKT